jgi:hypothetical protein
MKSLMAYSFTQDTPTTFKLANYFSDAAAKDAISHAIVDLPSGFNGIDEKSDDLNRLVLLSDLDSQLTVLLQPETNPVHLGTQPVLEVQMPHLISRIETAKFRPPWRVQNGAFSAALNKLPDLLGTSPSGALVHMRLLPEAPARLLTFLTRLVEYTMQAVEERVNTCMDPMPVCLNPDQPRHLRPELTVPLDVTINTSLILPQVTDYSRVASLESNADRLLPIFRSKYAKDKLRSMLIQPCWESQRTGEFQFRPEIAGNDREGRCVMFLSLVKSVKNWVNGIEKVDEDTEMEIDDEMNEMETALEWCVVFVKEVLEDVL